MKPLTDAELAELTRLDKEATPGPWRLGVVRIPPSWTIESEMWSVAQTISGNDEHNAAMIIASRNALPRLLAEVRCLPDLLAACKEALCITPKPSPITGVDYQATTARREMLKAAIAKAEPQPEEEQ